MKIVDLSDLHFGNKLVSSEHMYQSLVDYAYKYIQDSDMTIISGDLFHSLLDFNHQASLYVIKFLNELFGMSIQYGFKLRLLRGTFSHDRNQMMYVKSAATKYNLDKSVDIKIYDKITVDEEIINGERISICYLPDDLHYKSEQEVLDIVKSQLATWKLDKVDMIVGHGYCQHVLPYGVSGPSVTYTIDGLSSICKHLAIFGHVHTPSVKKTKNITIIYVGSMERMNHGEEEKKGFITVDTSSWTYKFIENKNTLVFSTYKSSITDVDKLTEHFINWLNSIHLNELKPNYIRVIHEDMHARKLLGKIAVDMFPDYKIIYSSKKHSDDKSLISGNDLVTNQTQLVIPTEDNIIELLKTYIDETPSISIKISKEIISTAWNLDFDGGTHVNIE